MLPLITWLLYIILDSVASKTLLESATTPLFLFTISRHGDRSPIHVLPDDPYRRSWTHGYGQLTRYGAEQHIFLAKFIRDYYPNLLSLAYHPDEAFFCSSGSDRTLMSANSFVRGLYDSESLIYSSPPIYSVPAAEDHLLKMSGNCSSFHGYNKLLLNSQNVARAAEIFSHTLDAFEQQFPVLYPTNPTTADRLRATWKICDAVTVWNLHQMTRPRWLSVQMVQDCFKILDFKFQIRSSPIITRFRGGPLVAHMLGLFRMRANFHLSNLPIAEQRAKKRIDPLSLIVPYFDAIQVRPQQRLIAYFAHDSTLAAVMGHLQVFNSLKPPLASSLLVELHYKPTEFENFFLRFLYRNHTGLTDKRLFPLWPPACGSPAEAEEFDHLCPLTRLESAVSGTYAVDVVAECNNDGSVIGRFVHLSNWCYYPHIITLLVLQLLLLICLTRRSFFTAFRRHSR